MSNPSTNKLPRYVLNPLVQPTTPPAKKKSPSRTTAAMVASDADPSSPPLAATRVRLRTVMQATPMHRLGPAELALQRKNLWENAAHGRTTTVRVLLEPLLNEENLGLRGTLALFDDLPGLMKEPGSDDALKIGLGVLASLCPRELEGTVSPARVSEIINWVFGPALAQRSTEWLEAAVAGLCAQGTCWPEQVAAAAAQRCADMPLRHLDGLMAMQCVPIDLPGFFAAHTAKLAPSRFGALLHACCARLRAPTLRRGESAAGKAALIEKLFGISCRAILDAEKPAPDQNTVRWALSLRRTREPILILQQSKCSLATRLKLFFLVASVQGLDPYPLALRWQRDELLGQFTMARRDSLTGPQPAAEADDGFAIASALEARYDRYAKRCMARLGPEDAAARAGHEAFIESELQSVRMMARATGGLNAPLEAIQRSLSRFREGLRKEGGGKAKTPPRSATVEVTMWSTPAAARIPGATHQSSSRDSKPSR